jgi:hypothetical protein
MALLGDLANPDSHLLAELLLNYGPKSLDRIELAAVGWKVSHCEVITKQIINQLTVMSAVIVYHEMRTICFVAEACYDVPQELGEVYSVG